MGERGDDGPPRRRVGSSEDCFNRRGILENGKLEPLGLPESLMRFMDQYESVVSHPTGGPE